MDNFQFLKDELSNPKLFNKRIFYAKNANKYIELISIDIFIDKYLPYITNYVLNDENTEEVLTEYSKTFINFLKYLNNENTLNNYIQIKNNDKEKEKDKDKDKENEIKEENINIINDDKNKYNECIYLILKCFFEKFFIIEDEILKETSINNMKSLLLELDYNSLLKKEIENYLTHLTDNNKNINENKDINYENEVLFLFYSLLFPFIEDNEQKIEKYCNKLKSILNNNNQVKKKRLIIQNITNIIPFIKKSIENIKNNNDEINQNKLKNNIYIIKEILNSLNNVIDDKKLIVSVGMSYLYEIIIIYSIKNMTDIVLFYDTYNNILTDQTIDSIIDNFIIKLESFLDNEPNLKISLTWRIKVAYIENICRLNKFILKNNPNYFNDYFSLICQKILENNNINNYNSNNDVDLKISVLNHVEYFIPKLPTFIQIFKNITSIESNIYMRSNLGVALNKIINNNQFYEIYMNNNNFKVLISDIFNIIQNIIEKDKFEVKYYLLSSFEFKFFNIIDDDNVKAKILNWSIKLIIIVFETINEWRIRYNIYEKTDKFFSDEKNLLKIINLYQKEKNQNTEKIIIELINNIRYLIQLFFNDKANIIRTNCLILIDNIIKIEKDNNIDNDLCLIRIKEELIKYQISLFLKNNNFEDNDNLFNNISSLDICKNYCIKIFFLYSVKKFIHLYSKEEKNFIKDIIELIKKDKKYSKENIANNKINKDIEFIIEKINS